MSIFTRSRPTPPAVRVEPTLAPVPMERRDAAVSFGPGWAGLAAMSAAAGYLSPVACENLAAVVACVDAIAGGIASLPARTYRALPGGGREEVQAHPVARLIRAPNDLQSWPDWCSWTLAQALLHGNSLSHVVVDGAGRPTALQPIPWLGVGVQRLASGRIVFEHQGTRYLDTECLWLRDRSDDGVMGRSRLSRAPAVLRSAHGVQEFSGSIWDNAATPSAFVTLPVGVAPETVQRIRSIYEKQYAGAHNARRIFFGDGGMTMTPLSVSPEDAQVLASRQFSVIEICRLFGVPPPIVQDYSNSTFTNASQASDWFAVNTLTPWIVKLEAEFSRSVITDPSITLDIDLSGLVRGDYSSRWAAQVAAVQAGILTADEVRFDNGYGPLPVSGKPPTS